MSNFEIKRYSPRPRLSMKVPFAASRGIFLTRDSTDSSADRPQAALANKFAVGCLVRDVVSGGPSIDDRAQLFPGRIELPDAVNGECSLDPLPDAFEAEGSTYLLLSGTGALSGSTALETPLSFVNGKVYVAQTGDIAQYKLSARPAPETAGQLRIYAERL